MCHLKQHSSLQAAAEAGVLQGQGGRAAGGAGRGRAGEGGPPQLHEEGHPQAEGGRHRHQLRQGDSTTVHPGGEAEAEYYSYITRTPYLYTAYFNTIAESGHLIIYNQGQLFMQ